MYEYIEGKIAQKNPAFIIIDVGGVGYKINISLSTYELIGDQSNQKILVHQVIKEDAHILYGFINEEERSLFRSLISVSGIGANTAILILSSMKVNEIKNAIISGNVSLLQSIKGIGAKTAQRMIVELHDSLKKVSSSDISLLDISNKVVVEAVSALVMLGFKKNEAEKLVNNTIKKQDKNITVEEIIKLSLKSL